MRKADELQKLISNYFKNNIIFSNFISRPSFNLYNIILKIDTSDLYRESIEKKLLEWNEKIRTYSSYLFAVVWHIELRQIVLAKFKRFHATLTEKHRELNDKYHEISSLNIDIIISINISEILDEGTIDKHEQLSKEFYSIVSDIDMYMMDLQVGLQNEFYKKLFKKGVPIRKPTDPNIEVLIPEKTDISLL